MRRPVQLGVCLAALSLFTLCRPEEGLCSPVVSVVVGSPGNAADTNGLGRVTYSYRIARHEVTLAQYTAFLNAVAAVTTNAFLIDLWSFQMAYDTDVAGIERTGMGTPEAPYIYSVIGNGDRPVTHVSWFDAARFVNWMNNGGRSSSSTETGAYTLNGATSGPLPNRTTNAVWWLPNENEWYKSAFYEPNTAKYRQYPTGDSIPVATADPPGEPGSANWSNVRPRGNKLTPVGAYVSSGSAFGTFDQAGNVWEWCDTVAAGSSNQQAVLRGGSFDADAASSLGVSGRGVAPAGESSRVYGFRLASITNPPAPVRPVIVKYGLGAGGFSLSCTGTAPWPVVVQKKNSMTDPFWQVVSSNNTSMSFNDSDASGPVSFYRVLVP